MKVCDKTCIFIFFPIINKYFLMAKRSLLSRCPSYFSVPILLTLVDFKMVNLHACLRCVCVPPVKSEISYKVIYGNVSRNLRKSVDLGDSVTMGSLTLVNCVNKTIILHTSFPIVTKFRQVSKPHFRRRVCLA